MADKSFVLMSLKEKETKKLTQVLSNDTCRKILEYLSGKDHATESQIAKELGIPISTVHYNLKQLKENKLVTEDEYHYSEKGKEVIHYKIANKYIIIAPKEDPGFMDKLKSFIPLYLIAGAISGVIAAIEWYNQRAMEATPEIIRTMVAEDTAMIAMEAAETTTRTVSEPSIALWFFIGGISILTLMLIKDFLKEKKERAPAK